MKLFILLDAKFIFEGGTIIIRTESNKKLSLLGEKSFNNTVHKCHTLIAHIAKNGRK